MRYFNFSFMANLNVKSHPISGNVAFVSETHPYSKTIKEKIIREYDLPKDLPLRNISIISLHEFNNKEDYDFFRKGASSACAKKDS